MTCNFKNWERWQKYLEASTDEETFPIKRQDHPESGLTGIPLKHSADLNSRRLYYRTLELLSDSRVIKAFKDYQGDPREKLETLLIEKIIPETLVYRVLRSAPEETLRLNIPKKVYQAMLTYKK